MQILVNYPILFIIYGGNIDVSFVLRIKRALVNSLSSVFNRTSPPVSPAHICC